MPTSNIHSSGNTALAILVVGLVLSVTTVAGLFVVSLSAGLRDSTLAQTTASPFASSVPTPNPSGDADNDGWQNVDDPKPNSANNPDNDDLANQRDPDDDNDGILDVNDRYPLDQNNNGTTDAVERRRLGERYDGDRDRRPDLAELRKVALAEAEKLGVHISSTVLHLADVPRSVMDDLPHGWNYVCQDRDNDGNPDPGDRFDHSLGGSYANYTHGGSWESQHYATYAQAGEQHGFVGSFTSGSEPPRYEIPHEWSGYTPGSAATTESGSDPYASFYGHSSSPEPSSAPEPTSYPTDSSSGSAPPPPPPYSHPPTSH